MVRCWNVNPDFRPPFENLRQRMDSYISDKVCYVNDCLLMTQVIFFAKK